jgi:hypothetical protein
MNALIKKAIGVALEVSNVPDDLKADRRDICATCINHVDNEKCGKCGCYTEIKAGMDYNRNPARRFRIEKTHCPEGFWPYIDSEGVRHENDFILADFYNKN